MPFPHQDNRPFTQAGIELLGSSMGGVYGIFGYRVCIFIGAAADVKARLIEHLEGTSAEAKRIRQYGPTYYQVGLYPSTGLTQALADLTNEYRPMVR